MDGREGRKGMGSNRGNTTKPSSRVPQDLGSGWVSMLDTQALLQMEWFLCGEW